MASQPDPLVAALAAQGIILDENGSYVYADGRPDTFVEDFDPAKDDPMVREWVARYETELSWRQALVDYNIVVDPDTGLWVHLDNSPVEFATDAVLPTDDTLRS